MKNAPRYVDAGQDALFLDHDRSPAGEAGRQQRPAGNIALPGILIEGQADNGVDFFIGWLRRTHLLGLSALYDAASGYPEGCTAFHLDHNVIFVNAVNRPVNTPGGHDPVAALQFLHH